MKVYDETKTNILTEYDLNKGYLKIDTIINHIPEVKEVKEQGHYKTIKEYPNGGKDVEWVVEVEGVEYRPDREEKETIYVFIPYTEKELSKRQKEDKINEIKNLLNGSDYKAIKYSEGELSEEEYLPTRIERREFRKTIRELEKELLELEE